MTTAPPVVAVVLNVTGGEMGHPTLIGGFTRGSPTSGPTTVVPVIPTVTVGLNEFVVVQLIS